MWGSSNMYVIKLGNFLFLISYVYLIIKGD